MERKNDAEAVALSKRLRCLAELVTVGNSVADVGCDHGLLSIYLIQRKIAPRVLAMDVRSGPLSRAREHVGQQGLEEYITLRLSDGLRQMRAGEAQTLVCAGMGGPLMQRILQAEPEKTAQFAELILQPQSELMQFRRFLRQNGYRICEEKALCEEGKYYFPMKAVLAKEKAPERADDVQALYDAYGELLIAGKNPVLLQFLRERRAYLEELSGRLQGADKERAADRYRELLEELCGIDRVIKWME